MLDSLINLPAVIPSLWRSLDSGKKRRTAVSRSCFAAVEDLETRQLLSAANVIHHGGVPRIINGANTASFSAVGKVTFTPTTGTVVNANGTLIASQWILTTASASKGLDLTGGTATVTFDTGTYEVDQIVTYPKYKGGTLDLKQDIALWHITTPVLSITPLAVSTTTVVAKTSVTLVGFGGTGTGTTGSNGSFGTKQTALTKVERVSATQLIWKLDSNTEGTFAPNDLGAPVLKLVGSSYQILGVGSAHSTNTSKIGDTSYSTRTDLYVGWINKTLNPALPVVPASDDYADVINGSNQTLTVNASKPVVEVSGKFGHVGDVDMFKLVAQADGYVTIDLINSSAGGSLLDTNLEILAADGTTTVFSNDDSATLDLNSRIKTFLAAGTYYVRVSTYADLQKGAYRLTIRDNFDNVGDTLLTAKTLTASTTTGGVTSDIYINTPTDVDWVKFKATKTGKLEFSFTGTHPDSFDPYLEVYSAAGALLGSNDNISGANHDSKLTLSGFVTGSTYYIRLSGQGGTVGLGKLSTRKVN